MPACLCSACLPLARVIRVRVVVVSVDGWGGDSRILTTHTLTPTNPPPPQITKIQQQAEQDYPEAGISTAPTFTKYEQLGEDNLDDWVENGFGEFDDVEERWVCGRVVC